MRWNLTRDAALIRPLLEVAVRDFRYPERVEEGLELVAAGLARALVLEDGEGLAVVEVKEESARGRWIEVTVLVFEGRLGALRAAGAVRSLARRLRRLATTWRAAVMAFRPAHDGIRHLVAAFGTVTPALALGDGWMEVRV